MKPADTVMLSFFQIQNSLRFAHWRTKKYSTHKALDKFLDDGIFRNEQATRSINRVHKLNINEQLMFKELHTKLN
jgi:hypothetical protein